MKSILTLTIVIAAAILTLAPASAEAGTRYQSYSSCAPRYIQTREICRRYECRYATDHCGRRYSYQVTVVTYADYYSNGSKRSYTRVYRA